MSEVEIVEAGRADSLDIGYLELVKAWDELQKDDADLGHVSMHMKAALIWLRGARGAGLEGL